MKILLKAQACLPLHLPLGFMPDLSPSPRTPPFVSSMGMDRDQRVKALVSGAGSEWSQGAEDRQTLGHPTTLQLPCRQDPCRPGRPPSCPGGGYG